MSAQDQQSEDLIDALPDILDDLGLEEHGGVQSDKENVNSEAASVASNAHKGSGGRRLQAMEWGRQKRFDNACKLIESKEGVSISQLLWFPSEDGTEEECKSCILCCLNVGTSSVPGETALIESWAQELPGFKAMKLGKGKPYSFLEFDTAESASHAQMSLNGRPIPQAQKVSSRVLLVEFAKYNPFPEDDVLTDPQDIMNAIPGVFCVADFLTKEEEEGLRNSIQENKWIELSERQVQHHGFAFNYDANLVAEDTQPPLPSWTDFLLKRLYAHPNLPSNTPTYNQLTVNQYPPGSGIPPHTDTHSGFHHSVLIVSLASPIVMEFRALHEPGSNPVKLREDGTHHTVHVCLAPRSAVIMQGEARYGWEHGIRQRASDVIKGKLIERSLRTSLTFRKVKLCPPGTEMNDKCDCAYPWICDAKLEGGSLPDRFRPQGLETNRHGIKIKKLF